MFSTQFQMSFPHLIISTCPSSWTQPSNKKKQIIIIPQSPTLFDSHRLRGGGSGDGVISVALLPVIQIPLADVFTPHALLEQVVQKGVIRPGHVVEGLQVLEEGSELDGHVFEEGQVVILFLHGAHLLLVFDLAPRQLTRHELHQHVEQRPQVVMTTHLLQWRMKVKLDSKQSKCSLQFNITKLGGTHLSKWSQIMSIFFFFCVHSVSITM